MGAWIFKAFLLQFPKIEARLLGSFLYLHVYKSSHFPCLLASLLQIKQTNGLLHPFFWMHVNKGPCRNINDKPTPKKDEVTFLKDAAQAWGNFTRGSAARGLHGMFWLQKSFRIKVDITSSKLRLQGWPQEKALVHDWKLWLVLLIHINGRESTIKFYL